MNQATSGSLPTTTQSPQPPFEIINTPLRRPGSAGCSTSRPPTAASVLDGPDEATLVPSEYGVWRLLVGGPYPTFLIYLYEYEFPDPASAFQYASGRLRGWRNQVGRMGQIRPVSCGEEIGARTMITSLHGSREAA